jgi:hypothetical protein
MNLPVFVVSLTIALVSGLALHSIAQDSAPSSHLVFDDNFDGDILVNEVRVPETGEATYTYYEALGWRGTAAGYAGIQAHPKAHNFIFSIWDHKSHTAPIKAVYHGPGTETQGFGGEGTGLKSWNFELGWSTDVWYTLVARHWPVEDHTYFGFWARAGDTKVWTHLVTMDVAVENATFQGGTDAFIEDWSNSGDKPRTTHLRGGWKRKSDGNWFPFGKARYSVNSWDLEEGKRSFHYRNNWNGGVQADKEESYYFMMSGGADTKPATPNPAHFTIKRSETAPAYETIVIDKVNVDQQIANKPVVTWEVDKTTTPPFSYQIAVYDNAAGDGEPLLVISQQVPHARSATVDLTGLKLTEPCYLHLTCVDILDRASATKVVLVAPPQK